MDDWGQRSVIGALSPHCSKCHPRTSSLGITWEFLGKVEAQTPPRPAEWDSATQQDPRRIWETWKLESVALNNSSNSGASSGGSLPTRQSLVRVTSGEDCFYILVKSSAHWGEWWVFLFIHKEKIKHENPLLKGTVSFLHSWGLFLDSLSLCQLRVALPCDLLGPLTAREFWHVGVVWPRPAHLGFPRA